MKIVIISPEAGSVHHGMVFRPFYLAREFAALGHQVTVVASAWSHVRQVNPPQGRRSELVTPGVEYHWMPAPTYAGRGALRVTNMLVFGWRAWRHARVLAAARPDVVIVSSPNPFGIFGGVRLARRARCTLIYEVRDIWPLSIVELGNRSPRHPFIMLLQWMEDYAYRVADAVVAVMPGAFAHMEKHGLTRGKFNCIPNGVAPGDWSPARLRPLPAAMVCELHAIRRKAALIVGYAGSHTKAYTVDLLVRAAGSLPDQNVHVVLVGDGAEKPELRRLADALAPGRVHFFPPIEKLAVPALLAELDVLFVGHRAIGVFLYGTSMNKVFDYLMAAKPIIVATDDAEHPVVKARAGFQVAPGNVTAIERAILGCLSMPRAELEAIGARGRDWVTREHAYDALAARYVALIKRLAARATT